MRRVCFGLLIAAVLWLCYFSHLDALGFVGPDEPRYAWVARDMAASGDWVTPRLYGKPWFEKPVLYYWGAALGYRALGDTEIAARLPSALAAALATLTMGWLALQLYGTRTAMATMLILPTSVGMIGFARAATPDMLFSAALALAMAAAAMSLSFKNHRRPTRLSLMLFGAFLGAATLAKGPAAIVLAGGSLALWALVTRRWRNAFWLAHPWALMAFSIVALPWYVLCAMRNPEFLRVFLLEHNFARYLTPEFQHEQPFWFFGPILVAGLLPWTILLVGVGGDALRTWREKKWGDSAGFFFACWAIFPIVFFSLSKSKLPGYVLPAIAPFVLLAARSISRIIEAGQSSARWLVAGTGFTLMSLGVGTGNWLRKQPPEFGFSDFDRVLIWTLAGVVAGLVVVVSAMVRRPLLALLFASLILAGTVERASERLLPQWDPYFSTRAMGQIFRVYPQTGREIGVFRVHRTWHFGLNYYAGRELTEWTPDSKRPAYVLTNHVGEAELRSAGYSVQNIQGMISEQAYLVRIK